MSDTQPALSLRYFLNLEESHDGFALATFGKKQFTRFITPLMSVAIIAWGFYLGFDGVGRYYVALGAFFLILQTLMRYWFLPMMFKREQGIDLFQDYAELYANGRKQVFHYNEVQNFAVGKLTYMLELKNRTVVIMPKRAFNQPAEQTVFENTFKK